MPVQLKVKEMMVPIDDYAVTTVDKPLKEAVPELMKIYCQVETGKCTEAGHRSSLVLDDQGELVGILDFKSILKVLIPEIAGGVSGKLHALGVSIAFAEADAHDMDHAKQGFRSVSGCCKCSYRMMNIQGGINGRTRRDVSMPDG